MSDVIVFFINVCMCFDIGVVVVKLGVVFVGVVFVVVSFRGDGGDVSAFDVNVWCVVVCSMCDVCFMGEMGVLVCGDVVVDGKSVCFVCVGVRCDDLFLLDFDIFLGVVECCGECMSVCWLVEDMCGDMVDVCVVCVGFIVFGMRMGCVGLWMWWN